MNEENKNHRHSRMSLSGISHILSGCYYSIKVVILDLIQDLQRLSLSFINNVRGRFQIKFGMTSLCNNGGFTLIELLVVVLIIGILAAVALPQYQKAVLKSRNTEIKQLVKAIANAENVYFLANGKYAADFNQLDFDVPLTPVQTRVGQGDAGACNTTVQGTDSLRQAGDYYIALNSMESDLLSIHVVAYWRTGKYKCAGFALSLSEPKLPSDLHCREHRSYYKAGSGNFCKKIEQGSLLDVASSYWRLYSLP